MTEPSAVSVVKFIAIKYMSLLNLGIKMNEIRVYSSLHQNKAIVVKQSMEFIYPGLVMKTMAYHSIMMMMLTKIPLCVLLIFYPCNIACGFSVNESNPVDMASCPTLDDSKHLWVQRIKNTPSKTMFFTGPNPPPCLPGRTFATLGQLKVSLYD